MREIDKHVSDDINKLFIENKCGLTSQEAMHDTSAAEEQQNRPESILEHQTEFEVDFHIEGERLQRSRTRFKR